MSTAAKATCVVATLIAIVITIIKLKTDLSIAALAVACEVFVCVMILPDRRRKP